MKDQVETGSAVCPVGRGSDDDSRDGEVRSYENNVLEVKLVSGLGVGT